jgi:hypothetical protein
MQGLNEFFFYIKRFEAFTAVLVMISVFWEVRLLYLPFKDKHSPVYLDGSVKWSYTYADTTLCVCVCVCVDFININSF